MNIYFLSGLISEEFKKKFAEISSNVTYLTTPQKLSEVKELQGDDEKFVVIDPDFVEWKVTNEDLESVKNLRAVFVSSTSFGWVAQDYLNKYGIPLSNVKDWCTQAVAEWAIMMAFNLARKVPLIIKDNYVLDYSKYQGMDLKGKTVGIIGMGNIGKAIAERAEGLGMKVIYWSKNTKNDKYTFVELEQLFKEADVVFPTMADNAESKKVITDDLLKSMNRTAIFASIVHKYYNHDLVLQLVKEGKLYGYGFEDSTVKMNDFEENVWVAPEYAWCTLNSSENNDTKLLENIQEALKGNFPSKVNN